MRTLKTSEAAALLNVTPETLRSWERRFGWPRPKRSSGNHRRYAFAEIDELREALSEGLSISSAVSSVREVSPTDVKSLVRAFGRFDAERADRALEAALLLRSLDSTVGDVLLPAVEAIATHYGARSTYAAFACRWGGEWLRRAQRIGPLPSREVSLLVGDASGGECEVLGVHIRAFELFCQRSGVWVLTLPIRASSSVGELVAHAHPQLVVVAGDLVDDAAVTSWCESVEAACARLRMPSRPAVMVYGRAVVLGVPSHVLPGRPFEAQCDALGVLERTRHRRAIANGAGMSTRPALVVGISGSSAPQLAHTFLLALRELATVESHLVMTAGARTSIKLEMGIDPAELETLADVVHAPENLGASIASGSFRTLGMAVVPCSMNTLAAVATGVSANLLTRAADVTLKERRPLILVTRETPLSLIHLRNMETVTLAGATVLPPVPAFYHRPRSIDDLLRHTAGKVLDQLGVEHTLFRRWS